MASIGIGIGIVKTSAKLLVLVLVLLRRFPKVLVLGRNFGLLISAQKGLMALKKHLIHDILNSSSINIFESSKRHSNIHLKSGGVGVKIFDTDQYGNIWTRVNGSLLF